MKLNKIVFAAAAAFALAAGATGASAGGSLKDDRPFSWSGFYFGGQLGVLATQDTEWTHLSAAPHFNPIGTNKDSFNSGGPLAGAHVGYNVQSGKWVFGIEGSYSWADTQQEVIRPGTFSNNTLVNDLDQIYTVTGRVGMAVDRALYYVRGGYAAGRLGVSLSEVPSFNHTFADSGWTGGWTVGGGIEAAITNNVTIGIAYDYINLNSKTFSGLDTSAFAVTTVRVDPDPIHSVTGRVSFKFGN